MANPHRQVASELFRRRPCLNSMASGKSPLMLAAQGGCVVGTWGFLFQGKRWNGWFHENRVWCKSCMKIVLIRSHHICIRCTVSTYLLIVTFFMFWFWTLGNMEFHNCCCKCFIQSSEVPTFHGFSHCSGHPEIVELLLLAGADVQLELSTGASALHFAVYSGSTKVSWTVTGYELGFYGSVMQCI